MDEINLITLFLGAIFVNNFVLSKFLGILEYLVEQTSKELLHTL